MFGHLYERALAGEDCWIRYADGRLVRLPVWEWIGSPGRENPFDEAVVGQCAGPTIDLGCGPGRLVRRLIRMGIPALGVDLSPTAIGMARKAGAPVLQCDVFGPLPGMGYWKTVLLADGNVGLGGDPLRTLRRAAELLCGDGRCVVEFDSMATGVNALWVRLESETNIGPWFRWASVGMDCAAAVAEKVGLAVSDIDTVGQRTLVTLSPR